MSSNPCQDNLNLLYSNYFQLKILRGTRVLELMATKVNLPGLTIPDQAQPTIFGTTIPVPSMTVQFDPLSIEFLVDDDLTNWKSIYSWMRNITNMKDSSSNNIENYQEWHYQASLILQSNLYKYGGCNTPVLTVEFANLIPIKLSGLIFQSDSGDAQHVKASCMFKYSYYELNPDAPEDLS